MRALRRDSLFIEEVTHQNLAEDTVIDSRCGVHRVLVAIGHLLGIKCDGSPAKTTAASITFSAHDGFLNGSKELKDS